MLTAALRYTVVFSTTQHMASLDSYTSQATSYPGISGSWLPHSLEIRVTAMPSRSAFCCSPRKCSARSCTPCRTAWSSACEANSKRPFAQKAARTQSISLDAAKRALLLALHGLGLHGFVLGSGTSSIDRHLWPVPAQHAEPTGLWGLFCMCSVALKPTYRNGAVAQAEHAGKGELHTVWLSW